MEKIIQDLEEVLKAWNETFIQKAAFFKALNPFDYLVIDKQGWILKNRKVFYKN